MKRRHFLFGCGACIGAGMSWSALAHSAADYDAMIPAYSLPEEMLPREVPLGNNFAAGEVHVDPGGFALYWILPGRRAIRYAVGIGRPGLYHAGEFHVGAKREWPSWRPTPDMIARDPAAYERFAGGMPGGPNNPLGSRALYLFDASGRDTWLRIHGTNDPSTIGRRVSNGCARLVNDQIIDLYNRVPIGTRVVLHPVLA